MAVKKELISIYGINPNKISIIYNGVDTSVFRPFDKKSARRFLGLPENKKFGIWVGTNPRLKRLTLAIESVNGLKDTFLLVVGAKGVNFDNVVFCGTVYDKQLMSTYYNSADFLIFPSSYEGFPLVPLEALACGLPIIVSKESNSGEIIEESVHGFVIDSNRSVYYKEKVEFLVNNDSLRNKMSVECRELALNYSWDKQGEKYLQAYKRLLKS
jgi:glycosyltransferase involved in cell wall biosynthesis